jgi:hypothetical protein
MKYLRPLFFSVVMVLVFAAFSQAQSPWGDLLKGAQKVLGAAGGPADGKVVNGLKEALRIGTAHAVQAVSAVGGYYNNPKIRIPLPGPVQKAERSSDPRRRGGVVAKARTHDAC